ncbi:MAG: hypothetical protein ACKVU4_02740 [Phycisphaerales bacterium]
MTRLGPSRKRYAALRIVACLAITVIPGCAPYKYVQSRVTVLDAETGEPVRGAEVRLQYAGPPFTFDRRPRPETGTTDAHGVVVLPATIDRARMAWPAWRTNAEGFFSGYDEREFQPAHAQLEAAVKSGATDAVVDVTLRRWARPEPAVVVAVPVGYRGYVRVCKPEAPESSVTDPHRRRFECAVDEHGLAVMPPAPILVAGFPPTTYAFRFADGTDLPLADSVPSAGDTLAAWPLWWVDRCSVFVIADETTAASERKLLWPQGVLDNSTYPAWADRVRRGPFASSVP